MLGTQYAGELWEIHAVQVPVFIRMQRVKDYRRGNTVAHSGFDEHLRLQPAQECVEALTRQRAEVCERGTMAPNFQPPVCSDPALVRSVDDGPQALQFRTYAVELLPVEPAPHECAIKAETADGPTSATGLKRAEVIDCLAHLTNPSRSDPRVSRLPQPLIDIKTSHSSLPRPDESSAQLTLF